MPRAQYLDPGRAELVSAHGIEGPPTLVVEVLSPSTAAVDRNIKLQLYTRYGVPYYWIVDPEARSIEASILAEGAYALATRATGSATVSLPPFPDLTFAPDSLWPPEGTPRNPWPQPRPARSISARCARVAIPLV